MTKQTLDMQTQPLGVEAPRRLYPLLPPQRVEEAPWMRVGDAKDKGFVLEARFTGDDEMLRVEVIVRDPTPGNALSGKQMWKADSVQIAIDTAPSNAKTGLDDAFTDLGIALTLDGEIITHLFYGQIDVADVDCRGERTNDGYRVQATFPWSAMGGRPALFAANVQANDENPPHGQRSIELMPGMVGGKQPANFPRFIPVDDSPQTIAHFVTEQATYDAHETIVAHLCEHAFVDQAARNVRVAIGDVSRDVEWPALRAGEINQLRIAIPAADLPDEGEYTITADGRVATFERINHEQRKVDPRHVLKRKASIESIVHDLRHGPPRWDRERGLATLLTKWNGRKVDPCDADEVLEKRFRLAYGIEHQFTGEIDWLHDPTAGRADQTGEWQLHFNRHLFWITLAEAYERTGDVKYARCWEEQFRHWVAHCPRPNHEAKKRPTAWRPLEAGVRSGWSWPVAFEVFRKCPDLSDETFWLMLCAWREHGEHMMRYPSWANMRIIINNGLAHTGLMFPELDGAEDFARTAIDRAMHDIDDVLYPDGCYKELAPSYGMGVVLGNFTALSNMAAFAGRPLPERNIEALRDAARALARLAQPDGKCPPLHDSIDSQVSAMASDWLGDDKPWESGACDHIEWGGYAVLRRGPDRYALLDAGPHGMSHQHFDALQIVAHADGRPLLIDPGRPRYDKTDITAHLRSPAAHNVVLIDGRHHRPQPLVEVTDEPLPVALHAGDAFHVAAAKRAMATMDKPAARFEHERVLIDLPDAGWLVFDRVTPDDEAAHHWEWLWHVNSEDVAGHDRGATARYDGGALRIDVQGNRAANIDIAEAHREPQLRGWRSEGFYSDVHPCPVVRVITDAKPGSAAMFTLLCPRAKPVRISDMEITPDRSRVTLSDGTALSLYGADTIDKVERGGGPSVTVAPHRFGAHATLTTEPRS